MSEPGDTLLGADRPNRIGLQTSILIAVLCAVAWWINARSPSTVAGTLFLILELAIVSVVIWQACDPFADAAQWIGEAFYLPGSVRGATLDAVASSMPELFSGIFFVVLALTSAEGAADPQLAGAEGFGATIATCAGSAVYNMILIPAFCALVISYVRPSRPTIDVEHEVISRDGLWFVVCQIVLILFLMQNQMHWWMGLVLLGLYAGYVLTLYVDAKKYRRRMTVLRSHLRESAAGVEVDVVVRDLAAAGTRVSAALVIKAREELAAAESDAAGDGQPPDRARLLFHYFGVPLNHLTAWLVIGISTLVAAGACYFLVDATRSMAHLFDVPAFFVAVIVAAAASSVPDTLLAIGAARRGDDSGAVSNAFGSNIFDICVCLAIPLFVNSWMTDWQPVSLLQDGRPIPGLDGLRILLVVLTVITLAIMWHRQQLTRFKAVVLGSLGISLPA